MNKTTFLPYKKENNAFFLLAILVMLLTFTGCSPFAHNETSRHTYPTEHIYTQLSVTYSEENSQYSFKMDTFHVETDFAHYYFEQAVAEPLQQTCIDTTDCIIANLGAVVAKPEIYIFSSKTFTGVNIVKNALYTCQNNWQSVDYVTNVILASYGECSHYGLAYGYAAILCHRFGWETSDFSGHFTATNPEIFDLNLLCFGQDFVSEEDILVAQQTAYLFANYLLETYGEGMIRQLLAASHTSEFGTFYIGADWTDTNTTSNPLIAEKFLHENYTETKMFFQRNIDQMRNYQELFDLGQYDNDLTIIFPNSRSGSQYSYYQSGLHRIIVYNVDSLMHEYIHALTKPEPSQNLWETEGFARYFSYYYDYYGVAFLNEDYNTAVKSETTEYLFAFKETIARPIDVQTDFKELENIAVYSRNYTDPNASYVAGSSFVQYLVQTYGEATVVQCIYGNDSFPKPYSEFVEEWQQYIEETYSNFSRYNG